MMKKSLSRRFLSQCQADRIAARRYRACLPFAGSDEFPRSWRGPKMATFRAASVRRNDEATIEMANIPQKSTDPTEDALHAIEEALSAGQPDRRAVPPVGPKPTSRRTGPLPPTCSTSRKPATGIPTRRRASPPMTIAPASARCCKLCTTDRRACLISLPASPRCSGLPAALLPPISTAANCRPCSQRPRVGFAAMVGLVSAIVVPMIFFFVLAHMFRRSQDMRLVAETMAEVAMRLAQPETAAGEQIVTVGQAIRREVAAMGDGVERALARAAEFESLVHNEVSALERAYNDNEVRIRDLLERAHQSARDLGQSGRARPQRHRRRPPRSVTRHQLGRRPSRRQGQ